MKQVGQELEEPVFAILISVLPTYSAPSAVCLQPIHRIFSAELGSSEISLASQVDIDSLDSLKKVLQDAAIVVHCAGPFQRKEGKLSP